MKKELFALILILVLGASNVLFAQGYKHGLGLRMGPSYGLSYKSFLSDKIAVEALFSSRYYGRDFGYYNNSGRKPGWWGKNSGPGFNFGAMLQYHLPVEKVKGLSLYFGGGLHVGSWKGYKDHPFYPEDKSYFTMGIDFILGAEYQFEALPFVIALDYKPAFDFIGAFRPWPDELAVTFRFLLDKI
jgi:hypothetical protein